MTSIKSDSTAIENLEISRVVENMRNNQNIREKKFGDISSFNFTRKAFKKKEWDNQTTRARGLFIDTKNNKIVARSYDKFFNIGERPETQFEALPQNFKLPLTAYVKENGFLGLVSYDAAADNFFITSKSDPEGKHAFFATNLFYQNCTQLNELRAYIKENDVTFVFECVDPKNDPHIIKYDEPHLFLLDVIKNKFPFEKLPYSELQSFDRFGFEIKKKAAIINTWEDFNNWYREVTASGYKYNHEDIEGFVIEDAAGRMVKLKLYYYNLWKKLRSVANLIFRFPTLPLEFESSSSIEILFCGFLRSLATEEDRPTSIIELRELFLKSLDTEDLD